MRSHRISGVPKKCLNRNCDGIFTKKSHLGYMMQSEIEVYVVMRCPSCLDTFIVSQPMAMAHEYYEKLPKTTNDAIKNSNPITLSEMRNFRKKLSSQNNLKGIIDQNDN
jgi:hypothetical protein